MSIGQINNFLSIFKRYKCISEDDMPFNIENYESLTDDELQLCKLLDLTYQKSGLYAPVKSVLHTLMTLSKGSLNPAWAKQIIEDTYNFHYGDK